MNSDMYIVLHPDTANRIGINLLKKIFLQFGMQRLEVLIRLDSSLDPTTIVLSEKIAHTLSIPTSVEYEVVLDNNTLLIGPFIGILRSYTGAKPVEYTERSPYFIEHYKDIKGAIISFAFENIDKGKKSVKGYLYEPNKQKWIPGIYPYPASTFKAAVLNQRSLLMLQKEFGKNFFNSHRFNKWAMYKCLKQDTGLSSHLPPTILYTKPQDIFSFLKKHPCIYIKPLYGFKGKGIIKVIKNKNLIYVWQKKDNKNIKVVFNGINKANQFFDNILKKGNYIIQKMLDITFANNQVVDFRLILMKDQSGDWIDLGHFGRIGSPKNIVSNRSSGGKVEKDIFVLKQIFKLSQQEARAYRMQMSNIAVKAAKVLDKLGNSMGRYGVDLALDQNKNIWLIEMNHNYPNDWIASHVGDKDLIHKIRFHNLLYAKNLAGFPKHMQPINVKILCGDCSG
jgi:Glutathione synthase/Ribosomal protein S6 modification enzyme (glutaminyl transferase)